MNVFETIKAAVPMREAAEHYGLRVLPNGMACCPFHDDHHPSLKLNEDYFFCFDCNAHGDVIDFTARLWGLSAQEAVEKLRGDFGIETGQMPIPFPTFPAAAPNLEQLCICVLKEYLRLLQIWMDFAGIPKGQHNLRAAGLCRKTEQGGKRLLPRR